MSDTMPARLRHRVGGVSAATVALPFGGGPSVDPRTLAVLAGGGHRPGTAAVRLPGGRRLVEPYRLVVSARRWYLLAWDTGRDGWRAFRADRISDPFATVVRVPPREPPGEDPAEFAARVLHSSAPTYAVRATLRMPASSRPCFGDGTDAESKWLPGCRATDSDDTVSRDDCKERSSRRERAARQVAPSASSLAGASGRHRERKPHA